MPLLRQTSQHNARRDDLHGQRTRARACLRHGAPRPATSIRLDHHGTLRVGIAPLILFFVEIDEGCIANLNK